MDLHDKIVDFLRSEKGGRYCNECILQEVGADLEGVRKETASLGNQLSSLRVNRDICARCQASKNHLTMAQ